MRNKSAVLMIGISILMGVAAVAVASQWLVRQSALPTNKVVVAARDLPLGTPLTVDAVRSVDWPSSSLPQGAFREAKDVDTRVVKTSLQRGEPVLEAKLAPVGTKGGLSSVIPEGKRAITV